MIGNQVLETAAQDGWKIALWISCQKIFERLVRSVKPVVQVDLGVTQDDGEFRTRESLFPLPPFVNFDFIRQEFEVSIQEPGLFQVNDQARSFVKTLAGAGFHHADRLCLKVIVAQHEIGDLVGHFYEQLIALLACHSTGLFRGAEQNLDVDFAVGSVNACGVIDEVRVDLASVQAVFDSCALRQAEISTLANNPAT